MCEDTELCTHFKYHKHKIIHFLASMRLYRDQLKDWGKKVDYYSLESKPHFLKKLEELIKKKKVEQVVLYEVEDKFFEDKLIKLFNKLSIKIVFLQNPMFMCSRQLFREYLDEGKKPLLNNFYKLMRVENSILMNGTEPVGGKWNYDIDNRKKIPKKFEVEVFLPPVKKHQHISDVSLLVEKYFSDHPGRVDNYWIPIDRNESLKWLRRYLKDRFVHFGDFQDAIDERAPFLYHSVISPMMNIGFLLPQDVIKEVLKTDIEANLNSVEGFIRQVLGWREFVRGIYQNFDETEQKSNFFNHHRKLTRHWYDGTTGIPPLDDAIKKADEWGYCHHIERLMVIGNLMLMMEIHPKEVYRWFMEMFVDSSDWVMGPNVFGMSQFSDGGIFATKPYISGSNYLLKMSHYKKGDWCEGVDGLYWSFIDRHREFFAKNHRMSMMVRSLDKMDIKRKKSIFQAAKEMQKRLTKG